MQIRNTESLRARILRAGGVDSRVQFDAASEVRAFSLASSLDLVIVAGRSLCGDVDQGLPTTIAPPTLEPLMKDGEPIGATGATTTLRPKR